MSAYSITREACQATIDSVHDPVCPGCGGPVVPIETVDNSRNPTYWSGCETCLVYTHPVTRRMHAIACAMVESGMHPVYGSYEIQAGGADLGNYRIRANRRECCRIAALVLTIADEVPA